MYFVHIVVIESKVFDYTLLGALKLFFLFCSFIPFTILYILTLVVPCIVFLFFIIYIYPLFEPFLLLWSLLKCLFLLRSLVWPLLPGSTSAILYVVSILTAVLTSSLFCFFGSTKVYWLGSTVLSWRPLQYFTCYRHSFVSIFYLVDSI